MKKESNAFGIASLVCGIVGGLLFLAPYIGIFLSTLAIVFYGVQVKKYQPSGMATAGLITGIVGAAINLMMLLFIFLAFAVMGV